MCSLARNSSSDPLLLALRSASNILPTTACLSMATIRETMELHLCQFAKEKMGMKVFVEEIYISLANVLLATFLFFLLGKDPPLLTLFISPPGQQCFFPLYILNMNLSPTAVSRAIFGKKRTDTVLLVGLNEAGKTALFYQVIVTSLYPWKILRFSYAYIHSDLRGNSIILNISVHYYITLYFKENRIVAYAYISMVIHS